MTETISLFFYVAVLHFSFLYLKHRGLRHLAIAQGFSILLIGFRMSYPCGASERCSSADPGLLSTFVNNMAQLPRRPG